MKRSLQISRYSESIEHLRATYCVVWTLPSWSATSMSTILPTYLPTYIHTYYYTYYYYYYYYYWVRRIIEWSQQSGTRGLRPLLAQVALTLCLPVAWEQHWQCSLPFMFVFGDSSQADVRLLDPGTAGGLGSWRVLTEVSSSMSLMTSWHMGERLTSCGLGSEQRRLNRRILLKHINENDIAS
jgi:hypothetical protein